MSESDVLLKCIRDAFGQYADIVIADILKMADGDLDSWLWGLDIGYFSSTNGLEWRRNDNI